MLGRRADRAPIGPRQARTVDRSVAARVTDVPTRGGGEPDGGRARGRSAHRLDGTGVGLGRM